MGYIQPNKCSQIVISCVNEYMVSYFAWNIRKELVTSYNFKLNSSYFWFGLEAWISYFLWDYIWGKVTFYNIQTEILLLCVWFKCLTKFLNVQIKGSSYKG
jgi:hypothetical protein